MGQCTARTALMAFNLLCFLCGMALLITGLVLWNSMDTVNLNENVALHVSNINVVFGISIVLASLLGLFGILKTSHRLLCIYAMLLVLLIIAQITLTIEINWSKRHQDDIRKSFEAVFARNMYMRREPPMELVINRIQQKYQCCGLHSAADWGTIVPRSCCKPGTARTGCVPFSSGCKSKMDQAASDVATTIGWGLSGTAVVEFVSLVLTYAVIGEIS
ncbi:tetraspanin-11-like [Uranotaenia lowii]|uniref:tetraspanin-11-like n=1 Tax=Uranotaenia lowii TaxID=190385 RepID=UPI00247AF8F9|nr:tetraspanin-11-like [Uranotaenia lowii]